MQGVEREAVQRPDEAGAVDAHLASHAEKDTTYYKQSYM